MLVVVDRREVGATVAIQVARDTIKGEVPASSSVAGKNERLAQL